MAKPKQPRKEVVSFRLEPKIKYLVDIAARVQRRSPTNYIEYILEESLKNIEIDKGKSVYDASIDLWSSSEIQRIFKLHTKYPMLLTFEEEQIMEIVLEYYTENFSLDENGDADDAIGVSLDWEIIKLAASGNEEAKHWVSEKKWMSSLTFEDLFKLSNPSLEEIMPYVDAVIDDKQLKGIKAPRIKEIIKPVIKSFLLDNTAPITRDNIDIAKISEAWGLILCMSYHSGMPDLFMNELNINGYLEAKKQSHKASAI